MKRAAAFAWRERGWLLAFLLLLGIYLAISAWGAGSNLPPSPAMESFKQSEEAFKGTSFTPDFIRGWIKRSPAESLGFFLLSGLFALLFAAGCILNLLCAFKPGFRRRLWPPSAVSEKPWGAGMLLRVLVQFLGAGLGINLIFALLARLLDSGIAAHGLLLTHTLIVDALCVYFILRQVKQTGNSWSDLGLRTPPGSSPVREIFAGLSAYACVIPWFVGLLLILTAIASLTHYEPEPHPLVEIFLEEEKKAPWLIYFSVFIGCIAGPFFEEIFFRGFAFPIFKRKFGLAWALMISACFFALIHKNEFAFLPIFLLGILLTLIYEKRGSLLSSYFVHFFHNTLFILYFWCVKSLIGH